ncbi:glycosyltransferase family 4 protein [Candidatus Woesearchaeota archaeon]|nr:glycosyltransferase family 4 protein [Candidatus Woesearchaeota archaeon]
MIPKKKLLIATDNFLPRWCGISRFLSEIIPSLLKHYDVTVIAPDFGSFKPEGYRLVKIKKSRFGLGDYVAPKFSFRTVKREVRKADLVFTQTIGPIGSLAIYYSKKLNKKVATYIHSLEWELVPMSTRNIFLRKLLYPVSKMFTKFIYNKPDLLITPSGALSDALAWRGITTKKSIATLGVDCDIFKPIFGRTREELEEINKLKEELGLENSFVIGNHGRLANEKDLVTLLRAFKWFRKNHKNSKLLIVGDGLESIKNKFSGVEGCVLTGSKNNVHIYLNLMDVYVTSSLTETTSLTTLEAMASGLPVISTPVGFIKEYIKNNKNGLIFNQKHSFELFKKLESVKRDSKRASKLGFNARETVLIDFHWNVTSKKIVEALRNLS